jgi:hypothetical protein
VSKYPDFYDGFRPEGKFKKKMPKNHPKSVLQKLPNPQKKSIF